MELGGRLRAALAAAGVDHTTAGVLAILKCSALLGEGWGGGGVWGARKGSRKAGEGEKCWGG
jgi:hypothetical protein